MGRVGHHSYKVVGVFESNGSSMESEVLARRSMITNSFNRDFVSSIVIRLHDDSHAAAAAAYIESPAVALDGRSEPKYFSDLSTRMLEIVKLTSVLVAIMAIGAAFAVANTMYAAVDGRRREIAMLRTLGFPRGSILTSFLLESMLIGLIGCGVGLLASIYFNGQRQDFLSDTTWTVLAFEMRVTPEIVTIALFISLGVAVFGALAPALRASRVRVIEALRKA